LAADAFADLRTTAGDLGLGTVMTRKVVYRSERYNQWANRQEEQEARWGWSSGWSTRTRGEHSPSRGGQRPTGSSSATPKLFGQRATGDVEARPNGAIRHPEDVGNLRLSKALERKERKHGALGCGKPRHGMGYPARFIARMELSLQVGPGELRVELFCGASPSLHLVHAPVHRQREGNFESYADDPASRSPSHGVPARRKAPRPEGRKKNAEGDHGYVGREVPQGESGVHIHSDEGR
jgi:hypothetical protein